MAKVTIKDYTKEILGIIDGNVELALDAVGHAAEGYAKKGCPVDTGTLRNSITHANYGHDEYIGTNVEYAPYVEFGDKAAHQTGGAHFLRNAAADHSDEYKQIFENIIGKGLK